MRQLALLICFVAATSSASAQQVSIRIVDEPTRLGIAHATLSLLADGQQVAHAESDTLGFATFALPQRGKYTVKVTALGYAELTRDVDFAAVALDLIPAFVLVPSVLKLAPIEVNARRSGYRKSGAGTMRSSQIVAGEQIARLRAYGFMLEHAIRQLSGVRVGTTSGGGLCVESTRRDPSFGRPSNACRMVIVVINDLPTYDTSDLLRNATLDNFESVHYLSPMEAGFRYGMDAARSGALVIWTRGRGPHAMPSAWVPIKK